MKIEDVVATAFRVGEVRFRHPYTKDGIRKILTLQLLGAGDEDFQLLKNGLLRKRRKDAIYRDERRL